MCSFVRSFFVRTVEGSHVHGDGGDEALALVELPLQQLAEHVQGDELVAVEDGALRERAATGHIVFFKGCSLKIKYTEKRGGVGPRLCKLAPAPAARRRDSPNLLPALSRIPVHQEAKPNVGAE